MPLSLYAIDGRPEKFSPKELPCGRVSREKVFMNRPLIDTNRPI
jgi:hypothetical protein